jgi:hypothetical protein
VICWLKKRQDCEANKIKPTGTPARHNKDE